MSFTMSFRTGKDGEPVFGERPLFREEFLKKIGDLVLEQGRKCKE